MAQKMNLVLVLLFLLTGIKISGILWLRRLFVLRTHSQLMFRRLWRLLKTLPQSIRRGRLSSCLAHKVARK